MRLTEAGRQPIRSGLKRWQPKMRHTRPGSPELDLSRDRGTAPASSIPIPASHSLALAQLGNQGGASTKGTEQPIRTDSRPAAIRLRSCLSGKVVTFEVLAKPRDIARICWRFPR